MKAHTQFNRTADANVRAAELEVASRTLTPDDGLAVIAAALDLNPPFRRFASACE